MVFDISVLEKYKPLRSRAVRPKVTITAGNPLPVFYISSHQDFLAAIADSQSDAPLYATYQLQNHLVFDATHVPYLNDGSSDSDYLVLSPGQTFDGKGFTMTLVSGCEPVDADMFDGYLPSIILYAYGDPESVSTIQNVSIVVQEDVQFLFLLSYECVFTTFQNISIVSHTSAFIYTMFLFGYGYEITMDSLSIVSTQPVATNMYIVSLTGFLYGGTNTLRNSFFVAPSVGSGGIVIGGLVNYDIISSQFDIANVYIYLSSQDTVPTNSCSIFYGNYYPNLTTTLTNAYVVLNTYDEVQSITSPPFFYYNQDATSVITLSNVYTNNDNATIYSDTGIVNGSVMTRFTWASPPTFSAPNGFDRSSPNRLTTFLTFPFDASSYPSFDDQALFLQSVTSRPNAVVGTQEGFEFLYRLINPNAYAPIPKVITNEFIQRRDRAPNYIPSRNGFVI